jgi:hypothetical protein
VRLAFCSRVSNEVLITKATASSLIRRALSLLQAHFEDLLIAEGQEGEMKRCFESSQIRAANRGTYSIGINLDQVKAASVLKPIHLMKLDFPQPPKPLTVVEELARDVKRWARQAEEANHE